MKIESDVLIIGSGIAGLFSALKVSEFADVVIITKKELLESNTNYAQGGIASVLDKNDSFEEHIKDTLIAGAGLSNKKIVEIIVKEGPSAIDDLLKYGVEFSKNFNGSLDLGREGGHSKNRIVHAKDLTGHTIEKALINQIKLRKNIKIYENTFAIDLITEHNLKRRIDKMKNKNCWGAYAFIEKKGIVAAFIAKQTILATGGLGQIYLHTTNPKIATGDGFAMAYRVGLPLGNMEFIQFHPTALFNNKKENKSFLISEALRGFGAILLNKNGERFMVNYDKRLELAPRDIVARAIDNELKKWGDDFVWLDVSHKKPNELKSKFPNIYSKCLEAGIDITKSPIPVVPSCHYCCGGIIVNEFAETQLNGLFAVGEVTMTGVHGANRLASNSLLEAVVFAKRLSIRLNEASKNFNKKIPEILDWDESGTLTPDERVLITHSIKEVKHLMWDYVGIVRSNLRLEYAKRRLKNLLLEVEKFYKKTKVIPELIELRNMILCSLIVVKSAAKRKESRGLHYTIDYPNIMEHGKNSIVKLKP